MYGHKPNILGCFDSGKECLIHGLSVPHCKRNELGWLEYGKFKSSESLRYPRTHNMAC